MTSRRAGSGDVAEPVPWARAVDGGVALMVFVQPGASRSSIVGEHDGALRIRVAAPRERGRATAEAVRVIADTVGVSRSAISVERGAVSRHKMLRIGGAALDEVICLVESVVRGGAAR
ncbi:MAG TPA: DUF167 domain-containing protein [Microthrixaceae bacterium]|jgi:hypothetical protein|nr:DUF167 domain-containing protein [Actinomycetota bacterium]MBP6728955.1 DUF167 domain-containing protein [Microthrixaceae bacterium]HMT25794.1 DUF167 domain-containing protein [Microthrixaceae bacterium]